LASPVPRVLWKCRFSPVSGTADRTSPTSPVTLVGVPMPVVSPNERLSAPSRTARFTISTTRLTGTSPSYGQPKAVATTTWQVAPRACAVSISSATLSSDSAVDRFRFMRLWVSEALSTTSISVNPASRARSAPRWLGTSAE
jgi:hypothetical protein